jgi:alanine dehydrogenase
MIPRFFMENDALKRILDWDIISTIREVLLSDAHSPPTASLVHNNVWFGAMPAAGLGLQVAKLVGVYLSNPARGLPRVRGVLVAFREDGGEPVLFADAEATTGYRAAGATCLAVELLGYKRSEPAAIIGAGVQGEYHARCLREHYGVDEIIIWNRTRGKAEKLAEKLGGKARVAGSLSEIYDARLIIIATTSCRPLIEGQNLKPGTVVASIGAPKPVWELDRETLERAHCILADTVEGYWIESGEADHTPIGVKALGLRSVLKGEHVCDYGEIGVYKSVGTALFDLAAALYITRKMNRV